MSVLSSPQFANLMQKHIFECINLLIDERSNFSVYLELKFVKFKPNLPDEIMPQSRSVLFALEGYTLQSAVLSQSELSFEAGFGDENFASVVTIPLGAILHVIVDEKVVLVNCAKFSSSNPKNEAERSKKIFMSNPQNKGIFNK